MADEVQPERHGRTTISGDGLGQIAAVVQQQQDRIRVSGLPFERPQAPADPVGLTLGGNCNNDRAVAPGPRIAV